MRALSYHSSPVTSRRLGTRCGLPVELACSKSGIHGIAPAQNTVRAGRQAGIPVIWPLRFRTCYADRIKENKASLARRVILEGLIIAVLLMISTHTAVRQIRSPDVKPSFYQHEFAPAVALACGDEAAGQGDEGRRAIEAFLSLDTRTIRCADVAADVGQWPRNYFQKASRYLIGSVGLVWRIRGMSWDALAPLYALLYALTVLASYGILRLGAGKTVSLAGGLAMTFLPIHLHYLPHLRDYSKAPFILIVVLAMAWIVRYRTNARSMIILSIASGAITGLGVGFREDVLLIAPLFPLVVLLFSRPRLREALTVKISAVIGYLAAFAVVGLPVLAGLGGNGNMFHVILLGSMSHFDPALGIQPSLYEWGYAYNDSYVSTVVNSFWHRSGHSNHILNLGTAQYNDACFRYYLEILRNFPADLVARYWAALLRIVQPGWLGGAMPIIASLCIAAIASYSLRVGLFVTLVVLYLGGSPSLQFDPRHYFYLRVVPLFFIGMAGQQLLNVMAGLRGRAHGRQAALLPDKSCRRRLLTGAGFLVAILIVLEGPLWLLRVWQQSHVSALLAEIQSTPVTPVATHRTALDDGLIRFVLSSRDTASRSDFPIRTRYWDARFNGSDCGHQYITFRIAYEASDPFLDISRSVRLPISPSTHYYFATYELSPGAYGSSTSHLLGIDLDKGETGCLAGIGEVSNLSQFPLLPGLILQPGWQSQALYQRIGTN